METVHLVRIAQADVEARPPTDPDPPRPGGRAGVRGRRPALLLDHCLCLAATTAGVLGNEIVFGGVPLPSYKIAIAGYVVVVLLVFLGPLLMFLPQLMRAKIKSLHDYSTFAVMHNQMFDQLMGRVFIG